MTLRKGLTAAAIAALKPKDKPYNVSDIQNLRVHVAVSGRKVWQARRGNTLQTLGSVDNISIAEARRRVAGGATAPVVRSRRIGDLLEEYLLGDAAHLAPTTRRRPILYRVLDPIKRQDLEALSRPWLINRTTELLAEGIKPITADHYRTVARTFVNWCVDKEYLARSPMRRLPKLAVENRTKFLDWNQITDLEKACQECDDARVACLAMLALHAGLRRSEILKLEWSEVDLRNPAVTVLAAHTKIKKGRTVGLSRMLQKFLKERKPQLAEQRPFFFHSFHKRWRLLLASAGLPTWAVPHVLRHTFATQLVRKGVPLTTVQACLGHSSLAMTSIYAHAAREDVLSAARQFDAHRRIKLRETPAA